MPNILACDLSINGSGFTLMKCDDELNVVDYTFIGFTKVKKKELHDNNVHIILLDKGYGDIPYHSRGKIILGEVTKYIDLSTVDYVAIEDYAFASTGHTFDIAEVIGSIKDVIYEMNIPYKKISPSSIKLFATGKGNADKLFMGIEFNKLNIPHLSDLEDFQSPKADIVDSFWIGEIIRSELFYMKNGVLPSNYSDILYKVDAILGGISKKKTSPTITMKYLKKLY